MEYCLRMTLLAESLFQLCAVINLNFWGEKEITWILKTYTFMQSQRDKFKNASLERLKHYRLVSQHNSLLFLSLI